MSNPIHSELPPSLWAKSAAPADTYPTLRAHAAFDTVIVGGGFTGLSAALHLAQAGHNVALLESHEPGWGASGRNGGQVNPGWKILPEEILARYGHDRGDRILKMASATCDLVFELIAEHDIECEPVRPGYVQGANDARGVRAAENWVRQWNNHAVEARMLSSTEIADLLGTQLYRGGLLDPRGGNLQPLSYARGLARAAQGLGAQIFANSPVIGLQQHGRGWSLRTHASHVSCEHVILATNGYTGKVWPGLEKTVVPLASFVMASEPLSDNLRRSVLPGLHAVSETRRIGVYYRMDKEGRFVIGGRGNLFDAEQSGRDDHVKHEAQRIFPQLSDVGWAFHWGGYVAMTRQHTPHLFQLAPNVYAGMGYNGRGVAMATMMGKQLALTVLDADPDMEASSIQPMANHALRQAGISYHIVTGQWLDRISAAS